MKYKISDETIEYVSILAKLELSEQEKEQAKMDMNNMLEYVDKLNELDTQEVQPMMHVFDTQNVFREDIMQHQAFRKAILQNAPEQKKDCFKVPKTLE